MRVQPGNSRQSSVEITAPAIYSPPHTIRALYLAFQIPYVYDYITKICRKQAEFIQNHDSLNIRNIGKNKAQHRKFKKLKLGCG
jgi:hypothetical protein